MARKSKTKKRRSMDEVLEEEDQEEGEDGEENEELQVINGEADTLPSIEEEEVVLEVPIEPPVPQVQCYGFETAMKRVVRGIKVCRNVWDPQCFLTDKYRRVNGNGAMLSWNPGRADKKATDWMDFTVRLQKVEA